MRRQNKIKIISKRRNKWNRKIQTDVENNEDKLLSVETKIYTLLTNSKYEKHDTFHDIAVLQSSLLKLLLFEIITILFQIIIFLLIKKSNHLNLCHFKSKLK